MNNLVIESLKFSIKKAIQYPANLISWFLADISLYSADFFAYYLLAKKVGVFGDYSSKEVLLYITCFFLVNNIYAIIFAQAVSRFGESVLTGYFDYDLLMPRSIIKCLILKNINLPAACSTPLLVVLNIYCLKICNVRLSVQYVIAIFSGAMVMGFIFFIVYSLTLFSVRSEAISSITMQLLVIGEKPDTVFPKLIRNTFIYGIPIFLFSALPTRIALNKSNSIEFAWTFIAPFLYYVILKILLKKGLAKYQSCN